MPNGGYYDDDDDDGDDKYLVSQCERDYTLNRVLAISCVFSFIFLQVTVCLVCVRCSVQAGGSQPQQRSYVLHL
jgi:hypothetical protein